MALRARHTFIAGRVADAFGIEEEIAKAAAKKYLPKLNEFLSGDGHAAHILAYYQPHDSKNEDGEWVPGTGKPEVFFTFGDEEKLRSRAIFFIRASDKIDLDKASDNSILYGEIPKDPLAALETQLAEMYGKHVAERAEWGKASQEVKEEFKSEISKVTASLSETMKSFGGGMELAHIPSDAHIDLDEALKSTVPRGKNKKPAFELDMVEKLHAVLEQWCSQIDKYLGDVEGTNGVENAAGPIGIMDHWRARMQNLTSVTEQLKRKDVKTVVTILTAVTKGPAEKVPTTLFPLLRRWKDIDMSITESANEAKDNVKYLATLDKLVEPLYTGTPATVMDSLPALMNSIKMIHTIARYFNTPERMTDLFVKITHAMIDNCKNFIIALEGKDGDPTPSLWKKDASLLIARLESCLKLNELYQETYRLTKEKLSSNPKGKQFDFNEQAIFGRFDLFCRRVIKLIDLFSTIVQFRALGEHKLEGMEPLIKEFEDLAYGFQSKRHELLNFTSNDFDRDFVEFNVNIDALEVKLQQFINGSFESIKSIDGALNLLAKFKAVLQRESLKADLDDKVAIIFQSFGNELEMVQQLYEEDKHNPPRPRNLPPVAGNITWCRHLLQRIEGPMKRFEAFPQVFGSKDGKRIVKTYNRIARTLVAYEYLWYNAWVESIETAKAGLQATLIIRHPEDGKLYVNFDAEILQLIRETKCLDRLGVAIPESARIVLLQEAKFKQYYNDLAHALREYARITARIIPVTASLLRPSLHDMEYRLRPGMITLTWTSMNIDAYKAHVHAGLARLEELVRNVNDVVENRIEKNLRLVSKTLLVNLPPDRSFSLDEFVSMQQDHVHDQAGVLQGKNQEVESAVHDLIGMTTRYALDPHIEPVSPDNCRKLVEHYNHFMYTALLNCAKNSLNALKKRVAARVSSLFLFTTRPFFELEVQLVAPSVRVTPSLEEVQSAINKCATAVLGCSKHLFDWGQDDVAEEARKTFFERVTNDLEIVRVVLLLTGSVQGTRSAVEEFLAGFAKFEWLWKSDADAIYKEFMKKSPVVDDYERELNKFAQVDDTITAVHLVYNLGALALNTAPIKAQLRQMNAQWKVQYSDNLHKTAAGQLTNLTEYFKSTLTKLNREPDSLDSIKYLMDVLNEIRDREASIDLQINPVMDMYALLEMFLPEGYMSKEEGDMRAMLRINWTKLRDRAEEVTETIAGLQAGFRKKLLEDVKGFQIDVVQFRKDYLKSGPMVKGISPNEAQDRLRRFEDEFDIRNRKRELYCNGEDLFALPRTEYPELDATEKELALLSKLYTLYRDVSVRMEEWRNILWTDVVANVQGMTTETDAFSSRCKKMPKKLRDWEAYAALKKQIEDFQLVLPLLQELAKPSIMPRHWEAVEKVTGCKMNVSDPEFRLSNLLDAPLVAKNEDITEITDGADKELAIQNKLADIDAKWAVSKFTFNNWKTRGVPILMGIGLVVEELEDAQMQLQTMLTMRYVAFFRERASEKLKQLSDTSETLELWQKVQLLWCSLESVFLGGDIAKQMPTVAKKFQKIDKDFTMIMARAQEQQLVTVCCANEVLVTALPGMYEELERCQKSLEGYLEQKRNKFPRFYFVSNPVLLQILSQGSDPLAVQQYYEKIFDSISYVEHDKKDKFIINAMISREGRSEEKITFRKAVKVAGNIEDWLMDVLREMQRTMKVRCEECAMEIASIGNDLNQMRRFNDNTCGQYALLGIQLMWTTDCEQALMVAKKDKNSVKNANKKALDVLSTLSSWCLQDLGSKMNRTKVETLVTIQVHARDVINDIYGLYRAKKINTADDFEWLKQARFYWEPDAKDFLDENGAMRVRITDVTFDYQYEYLGCKERLVITPLTDRCYITLAQAMNMYFGGAPAGPAGTGKTETTKDMGRALGIFVVVTNCTDQMRYTDCAKIFKGLCQGGLWGCFDEFNRITLPVLSVVAQQVLAITNAKKANVEYFQFPGDPQNVLLNPVCGFFITMNPGYAGRQELPENLKALFRGVAMMVPDREIIKKVKLCSVGYTDFTLLARKFFICYQLCEQQLSKQKHYDFGLRNILSVLRTAGATKRADLQSDEELLLYRTLRDMNLSKFVAQDVPLFLSMLADLFPKQSAPAKQEYPAIEKAIRQVITDTKLINHPTWFTKIVQLYETCLVRHGIMLSGPAGGGKTRIGETLQAAMAQVDQKPIKIVRMNPKAVQAHELYGQTDPLSGEWVKGVFAAIWEKYNNRDLPYITWITQDGPVDAIWIEDLNTVLDDNKILTLASGDRIPMTDNVKIMFENESLANASPATVSRAGIIYVSETDLDWKPVVEAWVALRPAEQQQHLRELFLKMIGENTQIEPGHLFDFVYRHCNAVMTQSRVGIMAGFYNLLTVLMDRFEGMANATADPVKFRAQLEKTMCFCACWTVGGMLEPEDRVKFDEYMRKVSPEAMPKCAAGETVYEMVLDDRTIEWTRWRPPVWSYPNQERLDFSNLLVPSMDSTRALYLLDNLHNYKKPVMLLGGPGTAKTSTALMFFRTFDASKRMLKRINFSSATMPGMFQESVEVELDKRSGKSFGPPNNKKMTIFVDDISMPTVNTWGDQPTNEIVRQMIEMSGLYFLDKDKRGDFKQCEDLQYVAAMNHPGGGRNDVPNRLKRQFFSFNLVLPAMSSIDDMFGQMLRGRFNENEFGEECQAVVAKLTSATIELWRRVKGKMLPTPAKFHYIFNMRELSRVFQGVLLTPKDTVKTGGKQVPSTDQSLNLLRLWKHECARVFQDKLTSNQDKDWYSNAMEEVLEGTYGAAMAARCKEEFFFVDFFREDVFDEDDVLIELAPKIYESGGPLDNVRERVKRFMAKNNEENPLRKLELVLFEDALRHLIRISRIIGIPRGSALLVGVGGSGKQSLTRLSAYIARSKLFQITLTKTYNVNSLKDDLKVLFDSAGHLRKSTTFLFTDAEIKDENFLEYVNSVLMTGEVAGLFAKDEMMAMTADLQPQFLKERPGAPDTQDNLKQFFIDCARDNLHVVLCMSPVNAKFPERARKFPGLISGTSIDWFLPWPEEALISVSRGFLTNFEVQADPATKEALMNHMGIVHGMVVDVCDEYFTTARRHVYQTPKSYLSFISNYMLVYKEKLAVLQKKETNINRGLEKLIKGAEDVEAMKKVLAVETVKVNKATEDTNKMLATLQVQQADAEKKSGEVAVIKANCEAEATRIGKEKAECLAEDMQVLTSKGFLFLNEYLAVKDEPSLLVASFDSKAKTLIYEKPLGLIVKEKKERTMIEITQAAEAKRWAPGTDPDGVAPTPVSADDTGCGAGAGGHTGSAGMGGGYAGGGSSSGTSSADQQPRLRSGSAEDLAALPVADADVQPAGRKKLKAGVLGAGDGGRYAWAPDQDAAFACKLAVCDVRFYPHRHGGGAQRCSCKKGSARAYMNSIGRVANAAEASIISGKLNVNEAKRLLEEFRNPALPASALPASGAGASASRSVLPAQLDTEDDGEHELGDEQELSEDEQQDADGDESEDAAGAGVGAGGAGKGSRGVRSKSYVRGNTDGKRRRVGKIQMDQPAPSLVSNSVSLLITPGHDAYCVHGRYMPETDTSSAQVDWDNRRFQNASGERRTVWADFSKAKAGSLLSKDYRDVIRLLGAAENGLDQSQCGVPFATLNLRTPAEQECFAELLGYWFGDGSLKFNPDGTLRAVSFSINKEQDVAYLLQAFATLGLHRRPPRKHSSTKVKAYSFYGPYAGVQGDKMKASSTYVLSILDPDYLSLFSEFVAKYEGARDGSLGSTAAARAHHAAARKARTAAQAEQAEAMLSGSGAGQLEYPSASSIPATAALGTPVMAISTASSPASAGTAATETAGAGGVSEADAPDAPEEDPEDDGPELDGMKSAKRFPAWVKFLERRLAFLVLRGLRRADGDEAMDKDTVHTSSTLFRDEMCQLALHAGCSPRFFAHYQAGAIRGYQSNGNPIVANDTSYKFTYASGSQFAEPIIHQRRDIKEVSYNGRVWCLTMPHGFLVVRRAKVDDNGYVRHASMPVIIGNCEADLAKAQPIVDRALKAADSIKPADIREMAGNKKPSAVIKLIYDVVVVLFMKPLRPVAPETYTIKGKDVESINSSLDTALAVLSSDFLKALQNYNKDAVNEETVELTKPYTEMEEYDPAVAKSASAAAEGLCTWTIAMGEYYYASKFVKPKLEALQVAMASLKAAQDALAAAEAQEAEVKEMLKKLKTAFDAQMAEKTKLEDNAAALQRKLDQASALINGLAGERARWGEDSKMFADTKKRLLGDCAVACAFMSYCGPFNQQFRQYMVIEKFTADCKKRGVPVSKDLDVISFLVDIGTIGDWNLQGLPTDPLSIQNGILVTRSSRYPLLIDPQGQAVTWLRSKEVDKLPKEPTTALTNPKLKDILEFSISEGKALIIVGVEEELDPLLDPVLEKQFIQKGKKKLVKLADTEVEVSDEFALYFITRLPNPHFSPELQAKTTVVDFTVTQKGLEEQLLGRVISREQNALEKLLSQVLAEVNANTKALLDLDAQLLDRLSSNTGNLLDDEQLIDVLANTKAKAAEVKEKLASADETKKNISEKREQFRPVATRGSVLYFSIVEMSLVNVMYQTSLAQFVELFMKSMEVAEKANLASKRVQNIISAMTYVVYRYINKGLYERDKLLFVFIVAMKIMVTAGLLDSGEISLFMRGGAALDINSVRKKPTWISNEAWLNVIALSDGVSFFKTLPDSIIRNDSVWKRWYEDNEPEQLPIPDIEANLKENKEVGPWRRLLVIRSLRMDRTLLCVRQFVRDLEGLGEKYVEPVTDTIEMIFDDMTAFVPVIFLLSIGADPTDSIEQLAKKKKTSVVCVSLGEGQEPVAMKAMNAAAVNGTWVLLQNCELGLDLMDKMEDVLTKMREAVHADFRLFITALPNPAFPLGLLQMSTKVTNEPPAGLRAGILRSYTVVVDQDRLERLETPVWRQLVFAMCFQHSVVQERRKFGPLGWSIPYEYNTGDLQACLLFLEKHLYAGNISWPTVQYMISEAQYGGKVTDTMDRRLFNTYTVLWMSQAQLGADWSYNPAKPVAKIPNDYKYTIPDFPDIESYRKYISGFPEIDSPEIFGLHPNADLTFRVKEVNALLGTLGETQPKSGGGGGGKSLDEVVKEKALELLGMLPEDYIEEEYKAKIKKLGGMGEPLNIFLFQEIQRLQAVIARVRSMLNQMVLAIKGEVVMTAELLQAMNDVYDAKVPKPWLYTPGGDEFSWLLLTLGLWFQGLKEREVQLSVWLNSGRPVTFWMTGFANPQGFLTSMKQEVTRMHKAQLWALDEVDYHSEVMDYERAEQVKSPPKEGVYIHGLFIDGARWDKNNSTLAESEPKRLFSPMPVIMVTVMTKSLQKEARDRLGGERALYEAPCYRYPARHDRYRVFQVVLPTKNQTPEWWILRGAALLCVVS